MLKECEKICKSCPMRRDSPRFKQVLAGDIEVWYQHCFWPNWNLPFCYSDTEKVCLGAIIHILNENATIMLNPELREIAVQYDEDHELIFSSNNEFIRYHRGEDFGSLAWYKRSLAYKFSTSQKAMEEENSGQLKLF